jgi:WD40 repeat protein
VRVERRSHFLSEPNPTWSLCSTLLVHEAMVTAISFTPDSNYLVSGSTSGNLLLWDAKLTEEKWLTSVEEAHDLGVTCVDFSSKFQVNGEFQE